MISILQILESVEAKILSVYPNAAQYIDICPEQFERPAFLVERVTNSRRDVNFNTIQMTEYFTITCFAEVNRRNHSSVLELLEIQEKITDLFRCGYLTVGDRAVRVTASSGGRDFDQAYVDIQLEYSEEREKLQEKELIDEISVDIKGE